MTQATPQNIQPQQTRITLSFELFACFCKMGMRMLGVWATQEFPGDEGTAMRSADCDQGAEDKYASTDDELLKRTRDGDQSAFGELIQKHHSACVHLAASILQNYDDAMDEVQKAYWKAYAHLDQYRYGVEILPWLLRIVKTECLMTLRVRRHMPLVWIDDNCREGHTPIKLRAYNTDAEHETIEREMLEVMRRELRHIPRLLRNVIILHDIEELPMADVAKRLHITVPATKSRLLRARLELRKRVMHRCDMHALDVPTRQLRRKMAARQASTALVAMNLSGVT